MPDDLDPTAPETLEALARQGLLASDLQQRQVSDFAEENVPADIAERRWHHYEAKRQTRVMEVGRERRLVLADWEKAKKSEAARSVSEVDGLSSTMLDNEKRMLEMLQRSAERTLEQTLVYETHMAEMKLDQERRMEAARLREEAKVAELSMQRMAENRKKRQQLLAWEASEAALEEARRRRQLLESSDPALDESPARRARDPVADDERHDALRQEQERQRKAAADRAAEERLRKQELSRVNRERMLDEQEAALQTKLERLEAKQQRHAEYTAARKREVDADRAARAAEIEGRQHRVREVQQQRAEGQRARLEDDERQATQLLVEDAQEKENQREMRFTIQGLRARLMDAVRERAIRQEQERVEVLRAKEACLRERLQALDDAREEKRRRRAEEEYLMLQGRVEYKSEAAAIEARRMAAIEAKRKEEDERLIRVRREQAEARLRQREETRQKMQDRTENIVRLQRQQEYRRQQAVRHLNEDSARLDLINEHRGTLLRDRQKICEDLELKKRAIVAQLETVKTPRQLRAAHRRLEESGMAELAPLMPSSSSRPSLRPAKSEHELLRPYQPDRPSTTPDSRPRRTGAAELPVPLPPSSLPRSLSTPRRPAPGSPGTPVSRWMGRRNRRRRVRTASPPGEGALVPSAPSSPSTDCGRRRLRPPSVQTSPSTGSVRKPVQGWLSSLGEVPLTVEDARASVAGMRQRHAAERERVTDEERTAEMVRLQQLDETNNDDDRERLRKSFGAPRAKARDRIADLTRRHDEELARALVEMPLV